MAGFNRRRQPRYWLKLQTEYDMRTAMHESHDQIAPRIRVFRPLAEVKLLQKQ